MSVLTLLHITDAHLFADPKGRLLGVNTRDSLAAVLGLVDEEIVPDAVLMTGDFSHDGSVASYRAGQEMFGRCFDCPVYCLPGNHDVVEVMRNTLNKGPVRLLPACELPGWSVLMLDSTLRSEEGGLLSVAELQRLDVWLNSSTADNLMVCLHHNPVPVGSVWLDKMRVRNGQPMLERLLAHERVKGVVWGHVHQVFDQTVQGLRLLATPSTCIQFLPGSACFALAATAPGLRILRLYQDGRISTQLKYTQELPEGLQVDDAAGY